MEYQPASGVEGHCNDPHTHHIHEHTCQYLARRRGGREEEWEVKEGVCWVKNVKEREAQRAMRKTVIWRESVSVEEPSPFTVPRSLQWHSQATQDKTNAVECYIISRKPAISVPTMS